MGSANKIISVKRAMWSIILPVVVIFVISAQAFMPYPWHASCVINWNIPQSCDNVKNNIINQLKQWQDDKCPSLPCGQKCLYNFTSFNEKDMILTATHATP